MSYLACNRILYQEWEDRQYKLHLKKVYYKKSKKKNYIIIKRFSCKKLKDVKKRTYIDNTEPLKFPHLANNAKKKQVSRI